MSYLTDAELQALQESGLDPWTPFVIHYASDTCILIDQNRAIYGGRTYIYIPTSDELIREDVARWIEKRRTEERKAAQQEIEAKHMELL